VASDSGSEQLAVGAAGNVGEREPLGTGASGGCFGRPALVTMRSESPDS
jgi:hypothetical protein